MKRILSLVVLLLVSFVGFTQAPSNYTNINGRYRWIAGMFDSTFSLPKGATPSLRTGGSSNPGAVFYRTTDSSLYIYTGNQWLKQANASGFVPYTGATQNVNLGQYGLKSKYLEFDTSSQAVTERRLQWSNDDGTLQFGMTNGSTITNRLGLEQFARVKNVDATQINKGDVVYLFGASGDRASVKKADNRQDATSSKTLGVATEDIPVDSVGFVGTFGVVGKLDLSAYNPGDILYLDSIPGKMTKTKPQAPYHLVFIGVVERANSGNGLLFTNVQNGYELEELHNVRITSPVRNNALLAYDSVRALWVDTTLGAIGGVTGSGTTNYISKFTGTNTIGNSQIYDNGTNVGVGTISPAQKLDVNGNAYVNGQLLAGDTSVSTIPIQGADFNPTVFGRKAVTNTLSNDPRTIGVLGQTIARGSVANRLVGGAFFTGTDSSNSQNISQLRALQGWTIHNGTGTVTNAWGSYNVITNNQTGTITNAYGSVSGVENRSTGYIPKLHGQSLEVWNLGGGAIDTVFGQTVSIYNSNPASTIGAAYGVSIGKGMITNTGGTHYWRNSGTIGTSYGLYLDSSIDVGINKYSIYSFSNSPSYFRGSLGLGTSSPDSMLTVTNGALFQRGVRMSGLPTAPGTRSVRINANGTLSVADTLANGISGTGTTNYIPKFTSSSAIGNSIMYEGSNVIGIGTISPGATLDVNGNSFIRTGQKIAGYFNTNAGDGYILNIGVASNIGYLQSLNGSTPNTLSLDGNDIRFRIGSFSEAMRLDASGNLGLGTSSPTDKLVVQGGRTTLTASSEIYQLKLAYNTGTDGFWLGSPSANALAFYNNAGSERMRLDASGNLGLGITPSSWSAFKPSFQVGTASMSQIANRLYLTANAYFNGTAWTYIDNDYASQYFQQNGSHIWNIVGSGTAGNAISFTQAMTLDASGNLGIGTTSPTSKLTVTDATDISMSSAGAGQFAINGNGYTGAIALNATGMFIYNNSDARVLAFGTNETERMRITSGGNVGIGTTSPSNLLEVNGGSSSKGIQVLSSDNPFIQIQATNNPTVFKLYANDVGAYVSQQSNYPLIFNTNSTERMRITSGGNVGIGVTSPGSKLEVNGAIKTAAPSGYTAKPWKLGEVASTSVTLDTTRYVAVDIDGVVYYLALVTLN